MSNGGKYEQWVDSVNNFLLISDKHIIDLVPIVMISHRLQGDPVWCYLVAPPGGSKTEFINAMATVHGVYPLSSLTSKTLASGAKMGGAGRTASLLTKIQNGYITIEDFTTINSQNREEVKEIMGQMRSIYGGKFIKEFGTGERLNWEGKITLIAGATYEIFNFRELFSSLGERFLIYQIEQPDRKDASRRGMGNQSGGNIATLRLTMRDALKNLMDDGIKIPTIMPKLDEKTKEDLLDISEFVTRARSSVERDYRSPKKEIIDVHPPEMPTRFSAQLQILGESCMILNGYKYGKEEFRPENFEMLNKIGFNSISHNKHTALGILAGYERVDTAAIAVKLNFPTPTVRRWLEDMNALKVLDRVKGNGGPKGDKWELKEHYRDLMRRFEHIEVKGTEYTTDAAQVETGNTIMDENTDDGFGEF